MVVGRVLTEFGELVEVHKHDFSSTKLPNAFHFVKEFFFPRFYLKVYESIDEKFLHEVDILMTFRFDNSAYVIVC